MTDIAECPSDPSVAPAMVLASHPHDQLLDIHPGLGSPRSANLAPVILPGDQSSVPAEQSIWCHHGLKIQEGSAAELLSSPSQASALGIREPEALVTMVFPKDSVLLPEILDDILLIAAHPSRQHHHQKLKWKRVHGYKRTPPDEDVAPWRQECRLITCCSYGCSDRLSFGTLRHDSNRTAIGPPSTQTTPASTRQTPWRGALFEPRWQ